jgi:hypothetical protein
VRTRLPLIRTSAIIAHYGDPENAMLSAALMLAAAGVQTTGCESVSLSTIVRDTDDAEPFTIEASDGRRFRVFGQDFIDVRKWKQGEPLRICLKEAHPFQTFEMVDTLRDEAVEVATIKERVFADTCVERESGDTAGWIVAVSGTGSHRQVLFYWSEGQLMEPKAAAAPYEPGSGRLRFNVRADNGVFRFDGHLAPHELRGSLSEPWASKAHSVKLREMSMKQAEAPSRSCRSTG